MTAGAELGATPVADRGLAPDIARGGMLLLIALANVHVYSFGHVLGVRGYPRDLTVADQVVVVLQMLFVDGRAYPLFALLFGYGIVQLGRRRAEVEWAPERVTRLVRRRAWAMVLIGFVHGALLWSGDIIGAYGLIAVLLAGLLLRRSARTVAIVAIAGTGLAALVYSAAALEIPGDPELFFPSIAEEKPAVALVMRLVEWGGLGLLAGALTAFGAVALGVLAARHKLLDEPDRCVPLLRALTLGGLMTAVLLGLPLALMAAQIIEVRSDLIALSFGSAHALGGYAGGIGYAALFGLLAVRLQRREAGALASAAVESGRRSMSSYLAQSIVFVALLPAWTMGLGGILSVWQLSLLALGAWVVITGAAGVMGGAGRRGPAEVLLRRLTYGRR